MPFMLIVQLYSFERSWKTSFLFLSLKIIQTKKDMVCLTNDRVAMLSLFAECVGSEYDTSETVVTYLEMSVAATTFPCHCHSIRLTIDSLCPRTHFNHTASRHKLPVSVCFAPFSTFLAHAWHSWTGAASLWSWHKIAHTPPAFLLLEGTLESENTYVWW